MERSWDRFTLRIPITAKRSDLIKYWTSQEMMEKWFLRIAYFYNSEGIKREESGFIEAGDTYEWRWHGWDDETVERGEILSLDENSLSFTFGKSGVVDVNFKEEENCCIVELIQYKIPTDPNSQFEHHIGCTIGWTFYLSNLKSISENHYDLRNKDMNIKNVINS